MALVPEATVSQSNEPLVERSKIMPAYLLRIFYKPNTQYLILGDWDENGQRLIMVKYARDAVIHRYSDWEAFVKAAKIPDHRIIKQLPANDQSTEQ